MPTLSAECSPSELDTFDDETVNHYVRKAAIVEGIYDSLPSRAS